MTLTRTNSVFDSVPGIGRDGHQISVLIGSIRRVLVVRLPVEGQYPVGVDGEFSPVSPRQRPFDRCIGTLQSIGGHRPSAVLRVIDCGGTAYLQCFDCLVGDSDTHAEESLGRPSSIGRIGVVDMEAERVCVVSVVVSRVLVVRRLREGKVAVVIDVEKVAVPAAGLNGDYPAMDVTEIAVRVGGGGCVGGQRPRAVLRVCDVFGTIYNGRP